MPISFSKPIIRQTPARTLCALTLMIAIISLGPAARAGIPRTVIISDPQANVPETKFDFGELFAGEEVAHTFSIRNDGGSPLTLTDKIPGAPKVSQNLAPGPINRLTAWEGSTRPEPARVAYRTQPVPL